MFSSWPGSFVFWRVFCVLVVARISHFSHHNLWKVALFPGCCLLKKCIFYFVYLHHTNDHINIHFEKVFFSFSVTIFRLLFVNEMYDCQTVRIQNFMSLCFHFVVWFLCQHNRKFIDLPCYPQNLLIAYLNCWNNKMDTQKFELAYL